jgi:tetratricopeptide (TPR) repeat protein
MHRRLEEARKYAVEEEEYNMALSIIENFLYDHPNDLDALRLKGNILELKAYDMEELGDSFSQEQFNKLIELSRECYETLLSKDPNFVVAYIDLGDYWNHKGNHDLALKNYDRAIALLKEGIYYSSREEEFEEVYWAKSELLREIGAINESRQCRLEGLKLCPNSELLKD